MLGADESSENGWAKVKGARCGRSNSLWHFGSFQSTVTARWTRLRWRRRCWRRKREGWSSMYEYRLRRIIWEGELARLFRAKQSSIIYKEICCLNSTLWFKCSIKSHDLICQWSIDKRAIQSLCASCPSSLLLQPELLRIRDTGTSYRELHLVRYIVRAPAL